MASIPAPVIVPHPVIVPSSGHGDSGDIPDSWVIGYALVALVAWFVITVLVVLFDDAIVSPVPTGGDIGMAVMVGGAGALMWPFVLAGGVMWLIVRGALRCSNGD